MLDGDLSGQLHERTFADRVGKVARRPDHAVLRRDVDDPAPCITLKRLGQHLPHGGPAEQERTADVHREYGIKIVVLGRQHRLGMDPCQDGVVHEHIDAPGDPDTVCNELLAFASDRDVGPDELTSTAVAGDARVRRDAARERIAANVRTKDEETIRREPARDGAPDPGRRAGHDSTSRHLSSMPIER